MVAMIRLTVALFVAAVRSVLSQSNNCCPLLYIYQPVVMEVPSLSGSPDVDPQCNSNRNQLVPFTETSSPVWNIQANWTETEVSRFLYDFGADPELKFWKFTDNSDMPKAPRVLTFYAPGDPSAYFKGGWETLPAKSPSQNCGQQVLGGTDVVNALLKMGGVTVIVVDSDYYTLWQSFLTDTYKAAVDQAKATKTPPLAIVKRGTGDYNADLLVGMASLQDGFTGCGICVPVVTTPAPVAESSGTIQSCRSVAFSMLLALTVSLVMNLCGAF